VADLVAARRAAEMAQEEAAARIEKHAVAVGALVEIRVRIRR